MYGAAQRDSAKVCITLNNETHDPVLNNGVLSVSHIIDGSAVATLSDDSDTPIKPVDTDTLLTSFQPAHRLAVKTNFLYDAILLPDLEVEWRFNDNWSVALEGNLAWWGRYKYEKSYRLAMISPEVKRWIRPRAPWHGFYVGLFAGAGLYDLEYKNRGHRGEGVMGGLSVGYMWPLNRTLSLEAAIGGGYLYTRSKEYKPLDGHHIYQRTRIINYFGPLKVKLSLVWRLWDLNKSGHLNNQTVIVHEK